MSFRCFLEQPKTEHLSHHASEFTGDPENYKVLVIYACDLLSRTDTRFHISGFGDENWKVDVKYDLSLFMEQFPYLMRALASGNGYEMSLYSQGLERQLTFSPKLDEVEIRCASGTSWSPDPDREFLATLALKEMFTKLGTDFVRALETVDRKLAEMEPLNRWLVGDFH
jgi:hypothetical protein